MKKSEFRDFFVECKRFLKIGYFAEQCGIQPSRVSAFLRGDDYAMSLEKCRLLYNCIFDELDLFKCMRNIKIA